MRYPLAFVFTIAGIYGCDSSGPATSYHVDTLNAQQVTFNDSIASVPDTALIARIARQQISAAISKELKQIRYELQKHGQPSLFYTVTSENRTRVLGPRGLIINVDPAALETASGTPIAGSIDIEIKEALTQTHFLQNNLATVSDGKILVSGGAYYVNMTANGEQLKVRAGMAVKMQLPRVSKDSGMALFYAERKPNGDINWKETPQRFTSKKLRMVNGTEPLAKTFDSLKSRVVTVAEFKATKGISDYRWHCGTTGYHYDSSEIAYAKVYEEIDIQNFGWINCDRFLKETDQVAISYYFADADSVKAARLFLVFKDINSVLAQDFRASYAQNAFRNIPAGSRAYIIAIGLKNGSLVADKMELTAAQDDQSVTLNMKPLKEGEISQLFALK